MEEQTSVVFEDVSLADVSPSLRAEVTEAMDSWYTTPDFCECYCTESANRLRFIRTADGRLDQAFCYRKVARERLIVFGPLGLPCSTLLSLPTDLAVATVVMARMTDIPAELPLKPRWRCAIRSGEYDNVIELPENEADYLRSLGGQTRKHLPYYLRRAQREFGAALHWRVLKNQEIGLSEFESLVNFNRARLEQIKGTRSLWTEESVKRRWILSTRLGIFFGLYKGETLLAGTLSYLHKKDAHLALIGHNPDLDRLNMGNLALWLTINHLIQMRMRQYHLLWGASIPYKKQFGASLVSFKDVVLCSSRRAALLERAGAAKTAALELSKKAIRFAKRPARGLRAIRSRFRK